MEPANYTCLVVLLSVSVALVSAASTQAAHVQRGDVVYIEYTYPGTATNFRVRSPSGVVRGNLRLAPGNVDFRQIGISNDGNLAFLLRDRDNRRYFEEKDEDIWVVAMKSGALKVLSRHKVAPFMKNSLAGCRLADTAAVAAGLPDGGNYPVFLGLACSRGCNPRYDDDDFPLLSATWVLHLSYDMRTRKLSSIGATRTSAEKVCSIEPADQIRALHVPRLPNGKNAEPLMVFGERNAEDFQLRGVRPTSPALLSWRSGYECGNFVVAGPSEVYAYCPEHYTAFAFKQIKRTKGQTVVTRVGRIPAALGRGFYLYGMAALGGASQPFYAVVAQDHDKYYVVKHNKARVGAAGKVAFEMKAGSPAGGQSFLIAVVP